MTTATIFVQDRDLNMIKCRALLDTCTTANFISERLARYLKLPITSCALPVGAINSMNTVSKGVIQITIQSLHNEFRKNLLCLSIPTISDLVPSEISRDITSNKILHSNINLADPEFHLPRPIDLLIGAGTTLSLFSIGQIDLSQGKHDLYLQKTRFGWIVAGGMASRNYPKNVICQLSSLEQQITKF